MKNHVQPKMNVAEEHKAYSAEYKIWRTIYFKERFTEISFYSYFNNVNLKRTKKESPYFISLIILCLTKNSSTYYLKYDKAINFALLLSTHFQSLNFRFNK